MQDGPPVGHWKIPRGIHVEEQPGAASNLHLESYLSCNEALYLLWRQLEDGCSIEDIVMRWDTAGACRSWTCRRPFQKPYIQGEEVQEAPGCMLNPPLQTNSEKLGVAAWRNPLQDRTSCDALNYHDLIGLNTSGLKGLLPTHATAYSLPDPTCSWVAMILWKRLLISGYFAMARPWSGPAPIAQADLPG